MMPFVYIGIDSNGKACAIPVDANGKVPVDAATAAPTVTPNLVAIGASASGNIPSGSKGWALSFLTGSGTLGGVAVTAPITFSDQNTLATTLAYTTAAASSATLYYNT